MTTATYPSLQHFINRYKNDNKLVDLGNQLNNFITNEALINIYKQAIPVIEHHIWKDSPDNSSIVLYQAVFQEMEKQIAASNKNDDRYKFYIVVPVADRPIHLQQCLNSLLEICRIYQYGGTKDNSYKKVSVIVADDSKNSNNIFQHKQICNHFSSLGLHTEYLGADEQIELIKKLGRSAGHLQNILGGYATNIDPANFFHKGSATTRNIAYLRLKQIQNEESEPVIFYFVDSDQEFKIKIATEHGQKDIYAINYLYNLNEIFSQNKVNILTGKVVGDPPVSPAVMAGNFQNDVIDFLQQMALHDPHDACCFHPTILTKSDNAAYHDMASLFGFKQPAQPFLYSCTLPNSHGHVACFNEFANKLNRFFDGEHPTRVTYFDYKNSLSETTPARTIYTGNYAFKPENLKYFISFSTLKLRMSGPVLGRIIKAEIPDQFVSANLPMLHKRTTDETGESEFRPGVNRAHKNIDLSDEFERQFFGDVMLFTIENLSQQGYPGKSLDINTIEQALNETEHTLHQQYEHKHNQIMAKLGTLKSIFHDDKKWWNQHSTTEQAKNEIRRFIDNIEYNFGDSSQGYALINSTDNQKKRHDEIMHAITSYPQDRKNWETILT